MEWVVVKGISGYADGTGGITDEWKTFASVMAASVVENMLYGSVVFKAGNIIKVTLLSFSLNQIIGSHISVDL